MPVGTGRPLATRLLLAQGAVVAAGIVTASVVAAVTGPPIFHEHLVQAGTSVGGSEMMHVEEAFRDASLISLGVALVIALLCALVVTFYVNGRLQRPLASLTEAADQMGRGHYEARAEVDGAGPELTSLANAVNSMAAQLASTEDTRRRLLSDVAHEMRTPVATLGAYLDGLEDGVAEWGPETAGLFRAHVDRLARLCDDIGTVSRAEEGRLPMTLSPLRVADLVEAAVREAASAFEVKGVRLEAERGPGWDVTVRADRERLGQVMSNLLSNALRHTPGGGRVTVSAWTTQREVGILVTDTGEGLTPEQLPHVFERFYRGDSARTRDDRGSGIGLTIAKAIVDAHGGAIGVSSDGPGQGARFVVTLPRAIVS
jgi:two-component system sensor histidine kinase BaeS